ASTRLTALPLRWAQCRVVQCGITQSFVTLKHALAVKPTWEREELDNLCSTALSVRKAVSPPSSSAGQCLKPWKGRAPRSDSCDNDDCSDKDLELLKGCGTITLSQVAGVGPCPSVRACPTCGIKVEHDQTGCKNILCPRCKVEFCFVCLKLKIDCLETSNYFTACSSGIAPRQTAMPIWNRK
ncbi:unnamed protein product, partial [Gadus morhua 'NCC']